MTLWLSKKQKHSLPLLSYLHASPSVHERLETKSTKAFGRKIKEMEEDLARIEAIVCGRKN
jgi:hypothetical protein